MKDFKKITLVALRIGIGLLFLYSGVDKLLSTDFTSTGFLLNATSGPFVEIYKSMANSALVDFLVVWGEILIGIALVKGFFTRFAAYMGSIMMLLFYFATLPQEHGPVSEHIIYVLVLAVVAAYGAGRYFGLDIYLEKIKFVKKNRFLRFVLG